MNSIRVLEISNKEKSIILSLEEGHFCDLKSMDIKPAKLTHSISAFSNAEGGELYIGIDEHKSTGIRNWRGFPDPEAANGFIQAFESLFPLGEDYSYDFLKPVAGKGLVLKVEIKKTKRIKPASDGKVYLRRGAQNLPLDDEGVSRLRLDKGIASYETETVNADPITITNSQIIKKFISAVVPHTEPEPWLKKQQILLNNKPTVAGVVLFADEPQALLPKRCGIKLYRYKTSAEEGTRESMDFDPISIEACAYDQIKEAVNQTTKVIEKIRVRTSAGLELAKYPQIAIHEIITNAVIHRDYSIADDIHIRIFDNRVEVVSPGTLPGHITPENILDERFARNGIMVRLINKFPNPPNKDVGEGLNTVFRAMREIKLKDPIIEQRGTYVKVALKHESLASPEEIILDYLGKHPKIRNQEARQICFIGSENQMKRILQSMVRKNLIELLPGTTRATAAYRLKLKPESSEEYVQAKMFEDKN
jgi:ATP-dependent DNA helicase RecG